MFVYGLLKLERLGAFPFKVRPMALKAWKALNENYVKDGRGDRCFGRNGGPRNPETSTAKCRSQPDLGHGGVPHGGQRSAR